jgi:hypothetical protein
VVLVRGETAPSFLSFFTWKIIEPMGLTSVQVPLHSRQSPCPHFKSLQVSTRAAFARVVHAGLVREQPKNLITPA